MMFLGTSGHMFKYKCRKMGLREYSYYLKQNCIPIFGYSGIDRQFKVLDSGYNVVKTLNTKTVSHENCNF